MWVDFRTNNNLTGLTIDSTGFQLSLVSVSEDMRQVIETVTNTFQDTFRHSSSNNNNNMADQQLVGHIIKLLSAKVNRQNGNISPEIDLTWQVGSEKSLQAGVDLPQIGGESSLLTVVEESDHYDYPYNES